MLLEVLLVERKDEQTRTGEGGEGRVSASGKNVKVVVAHFVRSISYSESKRSGVKRISYYLV